METKNICRFIPDGNENERLHIINLVLETKPTPLKTDSVYKMYYVKSGDGFLHVGGGKHFICEGDIFFTFPAYPFAIESSNNLEYMYVSYLGTRACKIYEGLGISKYNFLFKNYPEAKAFWLDSLSVKNEAAAFRAESLTIYIFSLIAERVLAKDQSKNTDDAVLHIKKYIDDNISDTELSLIKISDALSYNSKYVSSLFKKKMSIGISEYIATVRIQHSCTLMEQGFTSIKDIALMCGFKDALYFSKVFKQHVNITPSQYQKTILETNHLKRWFFF